VDFSINSTSYIHELPGGKSKYFFFVINLNERGKSCFASLLITPGVMVEGRKRNIDFAARINASQM